MFVKLNPMRVDPMAAPDSCVNPTGHLFIDNARFVSMIAILMRHCELSLFGSGSTPLLESALIQFRTFGVQIFFVNCAFLMTEWLSRRGHNSREYWTSRVRQLGIPWLVWVIIYVAIESIKSFERHDDPIRALPAIALNAVFYQSYWFVPILLFSLALLLPLRCCWNSRWLGLGLLVLSLTYGVNQYGKWLPVSHTTALFGYLFPLWFGIQLFRHFQTVSEGIYRTPWSVIVSLACFAFGSTIAEDRIMESLGFPDAYNALQISNQIYAYVVLILLIKLPLRLVPSFIDVRKDTYGIYLTHQVVASIGMGILHLMTGVRGLAKLGLSPLPRICIWFLWSAVVYTGSLLITKLLRKTSFAFLVGMKLNPAMPRGVQV